jgi:hypothetical protein
MDAELPWRIARIKALKIEGDALSRARALVKSLGKVAA